uniref:Uncharacterized protein n=1 Tax=Daphnia magna TaxID=35525 RepID=A0A0N8BXA8_9CRUS
MQEDCIQEQEGYMQEQEDCMQEGCMQEQEGYTHKLGNRRKELLDLRVVKILDGYRRKEQMVEQNKTVDRNTVVLVAYCKTKQLLGYHIRHPHQECELGRHHHDHDHGHGARDVHAHRVIVFHGRLEQWPTRDITAEEQIV